MEVEPGALDPRKELAHKYPAKKSLQEFLRWQASLENLNLSNPYGKTRPGDDNPQKQAAWENAENFVDKNLEEWGAIDYEVMAHMEHHGLYVRLELDSLEEKPFAHVINYAKYPKWESEVDMFDKETSYEFHEWEVDKATGRGWWAYKREKKPLLMIKTRPVEGKFIHRIGRAPTDKERLGLSHLPGLQR